MAEWSKAPDSSSGLRERAWVQIPLLTNSTSTSKNSTNNNHLEFDDEQVNNNLLQFFYEEGISMED
ncbi:hypothetical protein MTR_8g021160 [Medicago truncatula]|uniref:Uncharacterized protein n=1 Tax=Medicago truncatula TaxID=3880 RepID=G7L7L6_MEDTR|nr:hypothetical protein MTR_8g021160 [Medicago truncatula]